MLKINGFAKKSFLPLSAILLLSSCSNPDFNSVQKFSQNSGRVSELSTEVGTDIYDSCLRKANYTAVETQYLRFGLIPPTSPADRNQDINQLKKSMNTKQGMFEDCDRDYRPTSENFKGANQVIISYMEGLGKLATGSNFPFDESINKIGEGIKGLNNLSANNPNAKIAVKIDAPSVDAGVSIFKVIVNFIARGYRGDKLREVIVCSNEDFHIYLTGNPPPKASKDYQLPTGGLIQATREYVGNFDANNNIGSGILGLEKYQVTSFRDQYLDILKSPALKESQRLEQLTKVKTDYDKSMSLIQEKQNKAQTHIKILEATAAAHNLLNKEFGGENINAKQDPLCSDIITSKSVNKGKENSPLSKPLTSKEKQRAIEILAAYQQTVETLLQQAENNSD